VAEESNVRFTEREALFYHSTIRPGKIEIIASKPMATQRDLSLAYSPGVAVPVQAIADDPATAYDYTAKGNLVAVITNGTAILGMGNLGALAAKPVMEGKAALFKRFADIDSIDIELDSQDPDAIIAAVAMMEPSFGGINLEDIKAPECFIIEQALRERMKIPVMHDDQHGTAVVLLAALVNALKLVGKKLEDVTVVILGIGAAGGACAKLLFSAGVGDVIGVERHGALVRGEKYDHPIWQWIADNGNKRKKSGSLSDVLKGADVFVGLSRPNLLPLDAVRSMAKDPIVFAMANPLPEISPEAAEPFVAVMATGRSDYPNQVNNLLAFPGIFRGALDARARRIDDGMFLAAAHAIAGVIGEDELSNEYIIPSVFDKRVVDAVRHAVVAAALESGVARRTVAQDDEPMA